DRRAVAAGDEDAAEVLALVVVGAVLAAPQGRGQFQSPALRRMPELQRADLLAHLGAVGPGTVELGVAVGLQETALQLERLAHPHATAQAQRDVAIAVGAGLSGEAALEQRTRAPAGVEAVGGIVGAM